MKRIPMGYQARIEAAERRRRMLRAARAAVITFAALTAMLWGYVFLQD
jgi:hypothetical protein